MQYRKGNLLPHTLAIGAALAMTACGGGGGSDSPSPNTVTLSGVVAGNGTLKNVIVCLDANANGACDSGEPASAATGADGKYSLTYDPAVVASVSTARLIAPIKTGSPSAATTAIDSGNPTVAATTADYLLTRPAGSGGAINPLTTLVQAGVAAGMTEASARANAALQLAIDAAKIEDYQDDPAWDDAQVHDTARTAAVVVAGMLARGLALELADQQAAVEASSSLRQLNYSAPDSYYLRTFDRQAHAAGSTGVQTVDARNGKSNGQVRTDESLYSSAFLTPGGWKSCNRAMLLQGTQGNPSRSVYCDGQTSLGWTEANSVAGASMTALIDRWQGMPTSNTINVGISTSALKSALGGAAFPTGAEEELRTNMVLGQSITVDNLSTRGQPQSRNTLEAVIAYYPTSGAASPTAANTLSLALSTGTQRNLRVSFAPASATQGTATYYECDLNPEQTVVSNCAALTGTGSYRIDMLNGTRLLRFTGQPPTPAIGYHVAYAEILWDAADPSSQRVYRAHEAKPDIGSRLSSTNRLNTTAWAAMRAQLGL